MNFKPIFLVLAAVVLITALCACRPPDEEETAQPEARGDTQTAVPDAEPADQEAHTQERDGPQNAEAQPSGQTGEPAAEQENTDASQPEDSGPGDAEQEDEPSESEVTDTIEVEIDENQGTGGL